MKYIMPDVLWDKFDKIVDPNRKFGATPTDDYILDKFGLMVDEKDDDYGYTIVDEEKFVKFMIEYG